MPLQFTDAVTALSAINLDGLVADNQSCLLSGTLPTSSGSLTLSFSSYTIAYVATPGTSATQALLQSSPATYTVTSTGPNTYTCVDLQPDTSGTGAGTYFSVTGLTPATQAANPPSGTRVRIGYALINGTNNGITSFTQVLPPMGLSVTAIDNADETASNDTLTPTSTLQNTIHRLFYQLSLVSGATVTQSTIAVDATEAATNDSLVGGHLINNMDRIRYGLVQLSGLGSWASVLANTKGALLNDGTNKATLVTLNQLTTTGLLTAQSGLTVSSGTTSVQALSVAGTLSFSSDLSVSGNLRLSNTAGPSFTGYSSGGVYATTVPSSTCRQQGGFISTTITVSSSLAPSSNYQIGTLNLSSAIPGTSYFVQMTLQSTSYPFLLSALGTSSGATTVPIYAAPLTTLGAGIYACNFSYQIVILG